MNPIEELWYEPIKAYTFRTEFLKLSIPTAKAIVRACTLFFEEKEGGGQKSSAPLSEEERNLLHELVMPLSSIEENRQRIN